MRDADGAIVQWNGIEFDIRDLVIAQEALRDRERELSLLVDMVPAHIARMTPAGELSFFNRRFRDFYLADRDKPGMSRLQDVIEDLVHPDDAVGIAEALNHSLATGDPLFWKYRLRRPDGVYRWMDGRAEPLRDEHGAIAQWYVISIDIDDEMRTQETLRDRERQLQQLVDTVPAMIWCAAPDGTLTYRNKRQADATGITTKELSAAGRLSTPLSVIAHPDDRAAATQVRARAFETGSTYFSRYRQLRRDGTYRWTESRAEPLRDDSGEIRQWYGVSVEIDDAVRAQETLRDRERQLQQLIDAVPVMIWSTTPEGRPSYVNKRFTDVTGATLEDITAPDGSFNLSVVHPGDKAATAEKVGRSFRTGIPYVIQYRQLRRDGTYRWTDTRAEALRDESGTVVQWYGVSVDIDDQIRAEETLRESERRLQQMIDAVPVNILSFSAAGEPTYINKRYQDYLGISVPHFDTLQEQQRAIIHPEDFAEMYGTLKNCFETGLPFLMRYRRRGKDGLYRWTEGRAEPLRDPDGKIVQWYAVSLDIEDETRAQEALRQAYAKLAQATQAASLAELSASIAHEVNQPLAAIVANSHACQRWLKSDPPNLGRALITVERIIRDANSAADVVSRIRALFKQSMETRTSAALTDAINEARNLMAEEAARRRVRMELDAEDNLPLVAFDRVQLQQVLINLIRNGMDAMASMAGDRTLVMRVHRVGNVVQTEISDHGRGIEFPERIFEPFFTTRDHGMGMGLAICRSIVESHGGRLWAENNKPHGATFFFTLPVDEKADP